MKKFSILLLFLIPTVLFSQHINVVPLPQEVVTGEGKMIIDPTQGTSVIQTNFYTGNVMYTPADVDFADNDGVHLTSTNRTANPIHLGGHILELLHLETYDSLLGKEGYYLSVYSDRVSIKANEKEGIYRGLCTLNQMLLADSGRSLPCCSITDYPSYSYRAMHLDVCRHFFSKEFVKRYIDRLAYYKINTLHWHLTDDQGWRVEIKKYPKLTEVGAWRTESDGSRYGGYYTQEDIREIVMYAERRFVTIIPEIEMPGHSSAALAAYPYLGCTGEQISVPNNWGIKKDIYAPTDTVFKFFEDVMTEVCALFPGRYIHVGGDEAPKAQWKSSEIAQAVMKQNELKDEEELQHYFMHRVEQFLTAKGKRAIGWGEVVKGGLSDSIVVMSWLSKGAGIKAARHGNDVVMAPRGYCYFDYPQQGDKLKAIWMLPLPLKKVYAFDPKPKRLPIAAQKHIIGGEATLWTEYVSTEEQAWHQLFPRLAAMAEALWSNRENKNFEDFEKRLTALRLVNKQ